MRRTDFDTWSRGLTGALLALALTGCTPDTTPPPDLPADTASDVEVDVHRDTDASSTWSVSLADLYKEGDGCQFPSCDREAEMPLAVRKTWTSTRETTGSTCTGLIGADKRTKEGTVTEEEMTLGSAEGTCLFDGDGQRTGTYRDGTLARCIREERNGGIVSYTMEVIDFSEGRGEGKLRTFLRNVPDIAGKNCKIERDVTYTRDN